jgi:hypothetical protein
VAKLTASVEAPDEWQAELQAGPKELVLHYHCPKCRKHWSLNLQPLPWHGEDNEPMTRIETQLWCQACQVGAAAVVAD